MTHDDATQYRQPKMKPHRCTCFVNRAWRNIDNAAVRVETALPANSIEFT
jgi:hypothetical protein